jgi:hypothetical protein
MKKIAKRCTEFGFLIFFKELLMKYLSEYQFCGVIRIFRN